MLLSLTEILFRVFNGFTGVPVFWLRSFLSIGTLFALWMALSHTKYYKSFRYVLIFWTILLGAYAWFQSAIKHYYGNYFSLSFLKNGGQGVGSYALGFFLDTPITYHLLLIITVLTAVCLWKPSKEQETHPKYGKLWSILAACMMILNIVLIRHADPSNVFTSSISLLKNPKYVGNALNQLGLHNFVLTDVVRFFVPSQTEDPITLIPENPSGEPEEQEPDDPFERIIDDTLWKEARDKESNQTIQSIDTYFMSQSITPKNAMTGYLENRNLILIMVEAFDWIAIDPVLTPTLYKLKEEGISFENHYSPQYNCATAESELMALTSVYPVYDVCTMGNLYESASPQTLFNLFKDKGYTTSSYHNWNDQFYPRSIIHPFLGSDRYLDVEDLIPVKTSGWQSDKIMMKHIVEDLNTNASDKHMSMIITSGTHLPYDTSTYLSDLHVNKVKSVYPNAPRHIQAYLSKAIELDLGMQLLLEELESVEDTTIVLFSDHRPLNMPAAYLNEYSNFDRNAGQNLDRTPMIIYDTTLNKDSINTVSSTIDISPTLANLFNLDYDPRLYMGTDLFSEDKTLVQFQNGSWISDLGNFYASQNRFEAFDNETVSDEYVKSTHQLTQQKVNVAEMVYKNNYFKKRMFYKGN